MPEASREQIEAIVADLLNSRSVNYYERKNNRIALYFCEYKGIHFNIKITNHYHVEIWTYSDNPVAPEMRLFVLETLNAYQASNREIQAYIDEDDRIIFRRSFSCLEGASISGQIISANMEIFFKNTIHHKYLRSKFAQG